MNRIRTNFLFLPLLLLSVTAFSQKLNKSDKAIIANLKAHIGYLADDKLEGRRAGTEGEKLAGEYISTNSEISAFCQKEQMVITRLLK